jgi:hypothetical protein
VVAPAGARRLSRIVGRLRCTAGVASAPADPAVELADLDAQARDAAPGIGLCPSFWTGFADNTARAAIIIHALFHTILGPSEPRRVGEVGDETQRGPGRNFNVAGCYEFLVDDVFGTDSGASCPAIP